MSNLLEDLPRQIPPPLRLFLAVVFHLGLFSAALVLSFLVRFEFRIPEPSLEVLLLNLPLVLAIKAIVFGALRLFSGWWRYVSIYDMVNLLRGLVVSAVLLVMVNIFVLQGLTAAPMPRSIYFLDLVFSMMLIGGARGGLRLLRESLVVRQRVRGTDGREQQEKRVLILGAGDTGEALLRQILKNRHLSYLPVGFLDDDRYKWRMRIHRVPVLGRLEDLERIAQQSQAELAIIAMPSATSDQIRRAVELAQAADLQIKIVPALEDIFTGNFSLQKLREVSIEDLLRRDPVRLDLGSVRSFLTGRRVLITGAGGSIGSELCRQVAHFQPASLVMVDQAETPLFFIHRELSNGAEVNPEVLTPVVGDICDEGRMRELFAYHRPEVVIHAAAYKHVPMMERDPSEAIKNNIGGTQTIATLAGEMGVSTFVLISTDKAVNPTSIMGASKRIAEMFAQSLQMRYQDTTFCAVRFGNVLGSNGSVIPIFREQIRTGGPVTVTHKDMTRYFMTIPEASQLVLQAAAFGEGGELFILDMGQPVKIDDLARDMIRLSGFTEAQIPIVYSGIRPGEKLFEELTLQEEEVDRTRHDKIFVNVAPPPAFQALRADYEALLEAAHQERGDEVRRLIKALVPTYESSSPSNVIPISSSNKKKRRSSGDTIPPASGGAST